jgi:hypothetical protein
MKQYRITTQDLIHQELDDCYLAPDDPVHDLIKTSSLGGIGSQEALAKYLSRAPKIEGSDKGRIQRELGITPGTPSWFGLWFGDRK